MLFRRRDKTSLWYKIRGTLWPHSGWRRFSQYVWHRIARINASSHSLAAGVAAGVAVSFTPFLGLHIILATLFCLVVRGHIIAAALATFVGNPWTFPLMFFLTGQVGSLLLGERVDPMVPDWSWMAFWEHPSDYLVGFYGVVEPLVWGAVPTALGVGLLIYFPFLRVLRRYKQGRAERLAERAKDRAARKNVPCEGGNT